MFPPLSAALALLPLQRPATPWADDASIVFATPDGKPYPVKLASNLQTKFTEIVAGEPGTGKSVALGALSEAILFSGQSSIPFLSYVDKGFSAQGLIRLIREGLSPGRQHEVVGLVLENSRKHCKNPFDVQLGMKYPLTPEREYMLDICETLCVDPETGTPPNAQDCRQIPGEVIDMAFETNASTKPVRYAVTLEPTADEALEKTGTLGKLYISDIRMNIAKDLGNKIEGSPEHTLTVKKFASKFPFMLICDEMGYYFAPDLDKLAAQLRSLMFMLIILGQDIQAMLKHGKEVHSVNANLGTKQFMKTEDTEDTLKMIRAVGGTDQYAQQAYMDRTSMGGYQEADRVEFREQDNIRLSELKALKSGEGIIVFEDQLVRSNSIYIPDDEKISKLEVRINRYVPLRRPDFSDLCREVPSAIRRRPVSPERIRQILDIGQTTALDEWKSRQNARLEDKTLVALASVATDIDNREDVTYSAEERGILLFETAAKMLEKTDGRYRCLQDQKSIRILKKRIEEAHQNNSNAQSSPVTVIPKTASTDMPRPQTDSSPIPPNYDNYDNSYENIMDNASTDYPDPLADPRGYFNE
ncbi:UNVERIFIED_ORG: hypothetical protein M2414_004734 [Rahnella aquatilis]